MDAPDDDAAAVAADAAGFGATRTTPAFVLVDVVAVVVVEVIAAACTVNVKMHGGEMLPEASVGERDQKRRLTNNEIQQMPANQGIMSIYKPVA